MRNKEKDKTYWCSKKHCLGSCYRNCDIVELNNRRLKTIAISVVTIGSIVFLIFALSGCTTFENKTCPPGYNSIDTVYIMNEYDTGTGRAIICKKKNKNTGTYDDQDSQLYMNPDGNVTTIPVGTPLN